MTSDVVTLKCYTDNPVAYEYTKISKAVDYLPSWWRNIQKEDFPTMRHCAGFVDLYSHSFTIPFWTEARFHLSQDRIDWEFADNRTAMEVHHFAQRGAFMPPTSHQHVKVTSPWVLNCDEPVNFFWSSPAWNYEHKKDILVVEAVDNYKYQSGTNINFFIDIGDEPRTVTIDHKFPIVFLTPMTERKVVIENHLVTSDELDRKRVLQCPTFTKSYTATKRHIEEKEKNDE